MSNVNGLIKPSYFKGLKVLGKNSKLQKVCKFQGDTFEFPLQNRSKFRDKI